MKRRRRTRHHRNPLRFTPYAWAKLLYLRDRGKSEVGGFGTSTRQDLLLIEDILLVQQICTPMTVAFDDAAVANFFDDQIDAGQTPAEFGRIWIHTHPGDCPLPSYTDEETFARVFGRSDWAVMFILAQTGSTYARLRFGTGPGGEFKIPVEVDFTAEFPGSDADRWDAEYLQNVRIDPGYRLGHLSRLSPHREESRLIGDWLEEMHPYQGELFGEPT